MLRRGYAQLVKPSLAFRHVSKHELQNTTIAVVVGLARRVDANHRIELHNRTVVLGGSDFHGLGGDAVVEFFDAFNIKDLRAVQPQ